MSYLFFLSGNISNSCVDKCNCYYNRKISTLIANCSYVGLKEIPDSLPEHTHWLILSGNHISSLVVDTSPTSNALYQFSKVDLNFNNIPNISTEAVDRFIKASTLLHLDLSNNQLSTLPENIRNWTFLKTLKISENKFICDCDTFRMKQWLLNETLVVENFENIKCQIKSGKWISVVQMDKTDMGCVPSSGEPLSTWKIAGRY